MKTIDELQIKIEQLERWISFYLAKAEQEKVNLAQLRKIKARREDKLRAQAKAKMKGERR